MSKNWTLRGIRRQSNATHDFECFGRHLGYKSRSQLYKLMNDGWLDAYVDVQMPSAQRLLDDDGLQKTLQGLCQWRVDRVFLRR